jgi:hypothetical protein
MKRARRRIIRRPASAVMQTAPSGYRRRMIALEASGTAVVFVLYFLARGLCPVDVDDAVRRSLQIVRVEQRLGIFDEAAWQAFFLPYRPVMFVAGAVYAWAHYVVLIGIALWLLAKDLDRFRFARNVLLVSAVLGVLFYYFLPAAPPRLMALYGHDFGFRDTVHAAGSNVHYFQPGPFSNEYAALPSFHFGWMVLASAFIWINTASRVLRALAVLISVVMSWAITVTGNHYFVDMFVGGVTVAFAWWVVSVGAGLRLRRRAALALQGARVASAPVRARPGYASSRGELRRRAENS